MNITIKRVMIFIFILMIQIFSSSCKSKFVGIDHVELVRWEITNENYTVCGNYSKPCTVVLRDSYYWTSGKKTYGQFPDCFICPKTWNNPDRFGQTNIRFKENNGPIPPWIKIKGHWPSPGLVVYTRKRGETPLDLLTRDLCNEKTDSSEFEGFKLELLESYLYVLVIRYGENFNLDANSNNPRDVCLLISQDEPEVGRDYSTGQEYYVAGRIRCYEGNIARIKNCRYQIILYAKAFQKSNECVQEIYNALTHEFKHVLQAIELHQSTLTCGENEDNDEYRQKEQQANEFANSIFPNCNKKCR